MRFFLSFLPFVPRLSCSTVNEVYYYRSMAAIEIDCNCKIRSFRC